MSSAEREALGVALKGLVDEEVENEAVLLVKTEPGLFVFKQPAAVAPVALPVPEPSAPQQSGEQSPLAERLGELVPDVALVTDAEPEQPRRRGDYALPDFGTAMSKAFAQSENGQHFELELGAEAGQEGYAVPSSVFITDEGKVLFGFEAVEVSQELDDSNRMRLDSIKKLAQSPFKWRSGCLRSSCRDESDCRETH